MNKNSVCIFHAFNIAKVFCGCKFTIVHVSTVHVHHAATTLITLVLLLPKCPAVKSIWQADNIFFLSPLDGMYLNNLSSCAIS